MDLFKFCVRYGKELGCPQYLGYNQFARCYILQLFTFYFFYVHVLALTSGRYILHTIPRGWWMRPLRKHTYSNILKILPPKNENFQIKNSDIFHISAQNKDCGYNLYF